MSNQETSSNGIGLAGFIVSLVGLFLGTNVQFLRSGSGITTESLNGTGLGFTLSNIVDDDIYSGSSSSDSSDDEGGDNTKKNKNKTK